MPDIRVIDFLIPSPIAVTFDWAQDPSTGMLDETRALASAVTIALASDARATPDDVLPGLDDEDRRGWWGDFEAEEVWNGWPLGSRLWLLARTKIVDFGAREGATVTRVERYLRECLQPFKDKKIVSGFDVVVEQQGTEEIAAQIVLYRGPLPAISLRYQALWSELIAATAG